MTGRVQVPNAGCGLSEPGARDQDKKDKAGAFHSTTAQASEYSGHSELLGNGILLSNQGSALEWSTTLNR